MRHEQHCIDANKAYEKEKAEFESKYPNYCRNCRGWGGFISYYDPSPAGISLSSGSMMDFDLCGECVEQNKCPKCGNDLVEIGEPDDEAYRCDTCGWNDTRMDGLPEPPECFCDYVWKEDLEDYI